ncbi:FAD/NAD(P)-binding protein [Alienimonas sp. DA493]|uniref:FAD/NAD(P)-binding protein n=1 Tax=Alienimonas sp. DA493 TaxID=3373605 RepID=UPI003754DE9A
MTPAAAIPVPAAQDFDPWAVRAVRIAATRPETPGVTTYSLEFVDADAAGPPEFRPGQFNMLYLPAIGESAISLSALPRPDGRLIHTVRTAGNVTRALAGLGVGGTFGLRGPFGVGWPVQECRGRDVVLVAGGLGLAPLRPLIELILKEPDDFGRLTILCGARSREHLLYREQYAAWSDRGARVEVTVDRATPGWDGHVGVVTLLLDRTPLPRPRETVALLCGPDVMMEYALRSARGRGVPGERIWLNMERNMNCAIGLCGHCQFGPQFLCKDGPVLRSDRLAPFLPVKDL